MFDENFISTHSRKITNRVGPEFFPKKRLGSGAWGTVYKTATPDIVVKFTEDRQEATIARFLADHPHSGVPCIYGVNVFYDINPSYWYSRPVYGIWRTLAYLKPAVWPGSSTPLYDLDDAGYVLRYEKTQVAAKMWLNQLLKVFNRHRAFRPVIKALLHYAELGLMLTDLHPGNLGRDAKGNPMLIDFRGGISRKVARLISERRHDEKYLRLYGAKRIRRRVRL